MNYYRTLKILFINAGAIGTQLPAGCVATVKATLLLNNVVVTTLANVAFTVATHPAGS